MDMDYTLVIPRQTSYYNSIIIKDEDEDGVVLGTGDYIVFGVKVSPNDSSSSCIITKIITESSEDGSFPLELYQ